MKKNKTQKAKSPENRERNRAKRNAKRAKRRALDAACLEAAMNSRSRKLLDSIDTGETLPVMTRNGGIERKRVYSLI